MAEKKKTNGQENNGYNCFAHWTIAHEKSRNAVDNVVMNRKFGHWVTTF